MAAELGWSSADQAQAIATYLASAHRRVRRARRRRRPEPAQVAERSPRSSDLSSGGHGQPLILALDQGTDSSRSILVDPAGRIVASASAELPQIFPAPGEVEHDPDAIWATQLETAQRVLAESGTEPGRVAGIGIANQRETTIVWDRKTGKAVANALVWQDTRVGRPLRHAPGRRSRGAVPRPDGLPIDAYFSGPKIAEILDRTGLRSRARARGARLRHRRQLPHLAADRRARPRDGRVERERTLLFDIHRLAGRRAVRDRRGPRAMLPEVRPSSALRRDGGLDPRSVDPDRRLRGGPAGGDVRPGCLGPGRRR
jgi:glycerol kinase